MPYYFRFPIIFSVYLIEYAETFYKVVPVGMVHIFWQYELKNVASNKNVATVRVLVKATQSSEIMIFLLTK